MLYFVTSKAYNTYKKFIIFLKKEQNIKKICKFNTFLYNQFFFLSKKA